MLGRILCHLLSNPRTLHLLLVLSGAGQTLAKPSNLVFLSNASQNCPPSIAYSSDPRTRIYGWYKVKCHMLNNYHNMLSSTYRELIKFVLLLEIIVFY